LKRKLKENFILPFHRRYSFAVTAIID